MSDPGGRRLLAGEADLALVRAAPGEAGLSTAVIGYDRLRIAVDAAHALARLSVVQLAELADETFVMWAPPGRSAHTDFLVALCRAAGFDPKVTVTKRQGMPPITAVIDSGLLAFVTDPPGTEPNQAVVVLELEPPAHLPLQAVWVTDALPGHARALLERMRAQRVV